jgi:trehalose synthase
LLERVPLLDKHLDDYDDAVEPGTLDRIRELAAPLCGARVLHVNATAYGGGVAELLSTHVPLLRDLGIEAEWQVIHGSDEFFHVTKLVHNALQGADVEWTDQMERIYLETTRSSSRASGTTSSCTTRNPSPCSSTRATRASRSRARSGCGAATSTSPTRT